MKDTQKSSKHKRKLSPNEKRRKIFDLFSANLDFVKQHPNVRITPDIAGSFMCPLCMKIYNKEGLKRDYGDHLTLEDVPPKSLGGSVRTLTCKLCNNNQGASLDSHLVAELEINDFLARLPNATIDARFRPHPDICLPATAHFIDNYLHIVYRETNRRQVEFLHELERTNRIDDLKVEFISRYKKTLSDIALLRSAYLYAFSMFGYGFLVSTTIHAVRHQILNPKEKILPDLGIFKANYDRANVGVHVITSPKELQAFLVILDLRTKHRTTRHGVLLPGPTSPGFGIYGFLQELRAKPSSFSFNFSQIPDDDYLRKPELAFASSEYWKGMREESH